MRIGGVIAVGVGFAAGIKLRQGIKQSNKDVDNFRTRINSFQAEVNVLKGMPTTIGKQFNIAIKSITNTIIIQVQADLEILTNQGKPR